MNVLNLSTINRRVGIGTTAATTTRHVLVNGTITASGGNNEKNIIIEKDKGIGTGYFLTIKSEIDQAENTWAVTDEELQQLFAKAI